MNAPDPRGRGRNARFGDWRQGHGEAIEFLVEKIDDATTRSSGGGLSWAPPHFQEPFDDLEILASVFRFPSELPAARHARTVRRALRRIPHTERLTADNVRSAVRDEVREYVSRSRQRYVLLTGLSLRWMPGLATREIGRSSIRFSEFPPRGFTLPTSASDALEGRIARQPHGYAWVQVSTQARCPLGAEVQCMRDLDLLRGVWMMLLTQGTRRFGGSVPLPLGALRLGPIHTIHHVNGRPATEEFWREREYAAPPHLMDMRQRYERIVELERSCLAEVRRTSRNIVDLASCFVRYARALDEPDLETSVVRLWSVLETLTRTRKHREVIARVTSQLLRPDYHRIVLEHARTLRHHFVHVGSDDGADAAESAAWRVKDYVGLMFRVALEHAASMRNAEAYETFLDTPASASSESS